MIKIKSTSEAAKNGGKVETYFSDTSSDTSRVVRPLQFIPRDDGTVDFVPLTTVTSDENNPNVSYDFVPFSPKKEISEKKILTPRVENAIEKIFSPKAETTPKAETAPKVEPAEFEVENAAPEAETIEPEVETAPEVEAAPEVETAPEVKVLKVETSLNREVPEAQTSPNVEVPKNDVAPEETINFPLLAGSPKNVSLEESRVEPLEASIHQVEFPDESRISESLKNDSSQTLCSPSKVSELKTQINKQELTQLDAQITEQEDLIEFLNAQLNTAESNLITLRCKKDAIVEEENERLGALQVDSILKVPSKDEEIEKLTVKIEQLRERSAKWKSMSSAKTPAARVSTSTIVIETNELLKLHEDTKTMKDLEVEVARLQGEMEKVQDLNDSLKDLLKGEAEMESKTQQKSQVLEIMNERLGTILKDEDIREGELQKLRESKQALVLGLQEVREKALMETIEHENTLDELNMVKKEMEEKDVYFRLERHSLKKKHRAEMDMKEEMIDDLEKKILVLENTQHILFRHDETSKNTIQNITAFLTSLNKVFEAELKEDGVSPKFEVETNTVFDKEMQRQVVQLESGVVKLKMENAMLQANAEEAKQASNRTTRVLDVMRESIETEESSPQIVLDMKSQLREQQDLVNELLSKRGCRNIAHKLNGGISTLSCLLEAAIFGNTAAFDPKTISEISSPDGAFGFDRSMAILQEQKGRVREEVMDELKDEVKEELNQLHMELTHVQKENEALKLSLKSVVRRM